MGGGHPAASWAATAHPPPRRRKLLRAGRGDRVLGGRAHLPGGRRLLRAYPQGHPAQIQERGNKVKPSADDGHARGAGEDVRGDRHARDGPVRPTTPARTGGRRKTPGGRPQVRPRDTAARLTKVEDLGGLAALGVGYNEQSIRLAKLGGQRSNPSHQPSASLALVVRGAGLPRFHTLAKFAKTRS